MAAEDAAKRLNIQLEGKQVMDPVTGAVIVAVTYLTAVVVLRCTEKISEETARKMLGEPDRCCRKARVACLKRPDVEKGTLP
jgi:hypothetical protein